MPPWVAAGGNGLDCAWDYFNQAAVAKAIQQTGVPREQLFITTKVPGGGNALDVVKVTPPLPPPPHGVVRLAACRDRVRRRLVGLGWAGLGGAGVGREGWGG